MTDFMTPWNETLGSALGSFMDHVVQGSCGSIPKGLTRRSVWMSSGKATLDTAVSSVRTLDLCLSLRDYLNPLFWGTDELIMVI